MTIIKTVRFYCYWVYELCGVSYELCEIESEQQLETAGVKHINYEP